jgi:hypothetical protein
MNNQKVEGTIQVDKQNTEFFFVRFCYFFQTAFLKSIEH